MPLILTEEQDLLSRMAGAFLAERAPVAALRRLRETGDAKGFDPALWKAMAEMGWAGVLAPEEQGGAGLGFVEAGVIAEAMGRTLAASPYLSTAILAVTALNKAGSAAQKARWLPAIAKGEAVFALALEEGRKHAPHKTALKAVRAGNGFRLDGAKTFVADGHAADAVIVVARTAGASGETQGLTLFLVEPSAKGLAAERTVMVDSRGYAKLAFAAVEVDADAVLGEVDQAWGPLEAVLDAGRAALAAEMTGSAQEAFDRTLGYLKTRSQFGRPIGAFQALQHRAARLWTEIELARAITLKALQGLDAGDPLASFAVSAAKAKAGETALLAAQEAVQLHGGIGMTDEHEIGFFLKRVRAAGEMLGDSAFHADRLGRVRGF